MFSTKLGSLKIKDSNNIQFNIDLPEESNVLDIAGNLEVINSNSSEMNFNNGTLKLDLSQIKEELKDLVSLSQDQISITYQYINPSKSISENVKVKAPDGGYAFDSLISAIDYFNKDIKNKSIKYIGLLQILFGQGQSFVQEDASRNLTGPGCAYSNDPFTLNIGRKETSIQNIRLIGAGQGASTIRGSCILNIWNLEELPIIKTGKNIDYKGSDQYDLRILLQNFFWGGWLAINLVYNQPIPKMISPNVSGYEIFDTKKNIYLVENNVTPTLQEVSDWRINKKVEVLMMNVWIQLSEPPIQYSEEKGWESVLNNPKLNLPLFFINTPSLYRCFISNCNFLTYLSPASPDGDDEKTFADEDCEVNCNTPPPLVLTSAQFLNTTAVTDHFLQMCSFSCREFGAPNPEYKSLQIIRGDKISIANCQFSGKADFQCTKVAALGCYFLGTGIMPTYLKKEKISPTTHALEMRPPPWYKDDSVNKKNGYNGILTGPRLIISGCQFVTHTQEIYSYDDINQQIIKLPFTWEKWEKSNVVNNLKNIGIDQINVQFDTTTFYMVSPKDENKKDFSKGFNFKALILQNLPIVVPINTNHLLNTL